MVLNGNLINKKQIKLTVLFTNSGKYVNQTANIDLIPKDYEQIGNGDCNTNTINSFKTDANNCFRTCSNNNNCTGISYNPSTKMCSLKSGSCDTANVNNGSIYYKQKDSWYLPNWNSCNVDWINKLFWPGDKCVEKTNKNYKQFGTVGKELPCNKARYMANNNQLHFSWNSSGPVFINKTNKKYNSTSPQCTFYDKCNNQRTFWNFSNYSSSVSNNKNCKLDCLRKSDCDAYLTNPSNNKCYHFKLNDDNISTYSCNKSFKNGRWYGYVKQSVPKSKIQNLNSIKYEKNKCNGSNQYFNFSWHSVFDKSYNNISDCKTLCSLNPNCDAYLMNGYNNCNLFKLNRDGNNTVATYDCKSFPGGKWYGDLKQGIIPSNNIKKKKKVKYNNPYYIKNLWGPTNYLASCGYSKTCSSYGNLSVSTYKVPENKSYLKYTSWSRWKFVNKNNPNKQNLEFNDVVTIRLEANEYYLVTCSTNSCNSNAYLAVSLSKYKGPSNVFSGNAQYWKIVSPTGKTGTVGFGDEIKILNLWGPNSYLNTCGYTSDCGSNKLYGVNTTRTNTSDAAAGVSNWSIQEKTSNKP